MESWREELYASDRSKFLMHGGRGSGRKPINQGGAKNGEAKNTIPGTSIRTEEGKDHRAELENIRGNGLGREDPKNKKWHVNKYKNEDGSFTDAGQKRQLKKAFNTTYNLNHKSYELEKIRRDKNAYRDWAYSKGPLKFNGQDAQLLRQYEHGEKSTKKAVESLMSKATSELKGTGYHLVYDTTLHGYLIRED